jgi:hypothetical protein
LHAFESVKIRRHEPQAERRDLDQEVFCRRRIVGENSCRPGFGVGRRQQHFRQGRLRVGVDRNNATPAPSETRAEVGGDVRFTDAAFLVHYREDVHPPYRLEAVPPNRRKAYLPKGI